MCEWADRYWIFSGVISLAKPQIGGVADNSARYNGYESRYSAPVALKRRCTPPYASAAFRVHFGSFATIV